MISVYVPDDTIVNGTPNPTLRVETMPVSAIAGPRGNCGG